MSTRVTGSIRLTRWLFKEKREFSVSDGQVQVHSPAFWPRKTDDVLSVFDINDIETDGEVWRLGERLFEKKGPPPLKARADLKAQEVYAANVGLQVVMAQAEGEHERHRHVEPWPILATANDPDDERIRKAERDDKALALAAVARGALKS